MSIPPLLVLCQANCLTGSDTCQDSFCPAPAPNTNGVVGVNNSAVSLDINDTSSLYVFKPDGTPASPVLDSTGAPTVAAVEGSRVGYVAPPWKSGHVYPAGTIIFPSGSANTHLYKTTAGGLSGATEPAWPDNGAAVADGPVSWIDLGHSADGFQTVPIITPSTGASSCYTDTASAGLLNCPTGTSTLEADPYSALASPTQAGLSTYTSLSQACTTSATGAMTTCQPGVYNTPFTISGNPLNAATWAKNHSYTAGTVILPTGSGNTHLYQAATAGTSRNGGEPGWTDNGVAVVDGTVTWNDLGVPTTNLATGAYVINQGMQLGRAGKADNVILTSDPAGVLLNFNGDGQLVENVAWATVTLNPLTSASCSLWCNFAGISIFAPILPTCVAPNTIGCWTGVAHALDMFVSGAVFTRGIVEAPGDAVTTDQQGDNANGHFTQIEALIVRTLHVGWPNAILEVGGGPVISPSFSTITPSFLGQGAINQTLTIQGTNFDSGAAVTFSNPGITLTGPATFINGNQLRVNVTVSGTATPGTSDVTVINPDRSTVTKTAGFTVLATPVVTGLSPNFRGRGAVSQSITITGANFADPACTRPGRP